MTAALTREAIVEAAARAQYMGNRAERGFEDHPNWPEWDDLPVFEQAICRQFVFPVVLATLDALMPLVEELRAEAGFHERNSEDCQKNLKYELAAESWGRFLAHEADADRLLAVIAP